MKDYKYIRAWGMMLHAFPDYIEKEVEKARRDGAPETAIYLYGDGTWATFESIRLVGTKKKIQALIRDMEK